jgi:ADP-ribose pyrophosphatase YjhB (NUDIX family)
MNLTVYVMTWNQTGRLLVLQRRSDQDWTAPWDHVEVGEPVLEAVARVLAGQTGLTVPELTFADVRHVCWRPDHGSLNILVNTGTAAGVPENREKSRMSGLRWIRDIADVPLVSGLAEMIALSVQGHLYSEIDERR